MQFILSNKNQVSNSFLFSKLQASLTIQIYGWYNLKWKNKLDNIQ